MPTFASFQRTSSKTALGGGPELRLTRSTVKLPVLLSPRVQRIAVVGPTVILSMWLSSLGLPLLPRVTVCLGVGIALILLVARHQRRARMS